MSQWVDTTTFSFVENNLLHWGIGELRKIWTDDYVYVTTGVGLEIYDITSENKYAYIDYGGGFISVWGNDDNIFLGTTDAGIKYISKTCISGSVVDPYEINACLNDFSDFTYYHELESNDIRYIHGCDDVLCVVTDLSVEVVKLNPQSYRSYTMVNEAQKCFMTSTGKFYYIVDEQPASGVEYSLNVMNTSLADWSAPDYRYVTGSGIFEGGISINDIFITENTAVSGVGNTIFAATSSGIYKIDESIDEYAIYYIEG